ncbi:NAD(P)-dependent oxidoreductase [Bosea sp. BK604]|uniref:alanine dehydrogenase n=1 Tax=Bosea sp. BK604 TaxID=2512180 RepID=UPI001045E3EF|nr:NAD(P)-dependent oxidoreductase [Bosea sp. BK604]TCR61736.1 alanine dehydrogenase [Bosea sp. BK604]
MIIGLPRELKPDERRVALRPVEVGRLVEAGHEVVVETRSGADAGFSDTLYEASGARIAASAEAVFEQARLIVKVHELQQNEPSLLRPEHILLASLYCEANRGRLDTLLHAGITAFAVEHVVRPLSASSVLGGEIGALEGVRLLLAPHGGTGRHFAGHFGLEPARALVVGLGTAGRGALRVLLGLGMSVAGFDIDPLALEQARLDWPGRDFTARPVEDLPEHLPGADLVLNCVLWDKMRRDHLITRAMLGRMKRGAVIVDVAADRAGAVETSVPTTWLSPIYQVQGITHFCVENLPSASPEAASTGYSRMIYDTVAAIAEHGAIDAARRDAALGRGLICAGGKLVHAGAAQVQGLSFTPLAAL